MATSTSSAANTATKHLLLSPSAASILVGSTGAPGQQIPGILNLAAPVSSSSAASSTAQNNDNLNGATAAGTANALIGEANGASSSAPTALPKTENEKVYWLIVELLSPTTREGALLELSKKREQYDDLALVLWHSFGEQIREMR